MIIFNSNGDFHGVFSSLPNEGYLDETKWTIAEFVEGEPFDHRYNYTSVNNIAIKGDLIPIDTVEVNRLEAEVIATQYSRDRKAKYDLLNQDEMRYDDVKNSTTTWVDAIDAIKAAHPKP